MFNPTDYLIDGFVDRLQCAYQRAYGHLEPDYPGIIAWAGRMALENIADTDALYHNVEHTLMVTLVGQEILKGKHRIANLYAHVFAVEHYQACAGEFLSESAEKTRLSNSSCQPEVLR